MDPVGWTSNEFKIIDEDSSSDSDSDCDTEENFQVTKGYLIKQSVIIILGLNIIWIHEWKIQKLAISQKKWNK